MIAGAICLSHSPLLDGATASGSTAAAYAQSLADAREQLAAMAPDVTILFYPDHLNGFLYDCLPAFCIGAGAVSIGDYGSVPGALDVPEEAAVSLAEALLTSGIDVALSYDMKVDHGAAQPLELLSQDSMPCPVIPVFINCAAFPRPPFARARALGEAVGRWAESVGMRVVVIGSGGLSHDPPLPSMAGADAATRRRLIKGKPSSFADRLARQKRVSGAAIAYAAGESKLTPLNPEWDQAFMEALSDGRTNVADGWRDDDVTALGGGGGHEVRTWIAALASLAAAGPYDARTHFYRVVPEWLTGMGVLSATPRAR